MKWDGWIQFYVPLTQEAGMLNVREELLLPLKQINGIMVDNSLSNSLGICFKP